MFSLYYNGIYDSTNKKYNDYKRTLPYLTNRTKQDLILFLITPGIFDDAYKLASDPSYKRVFLFFPSDDHLFISDVVRLQNTLSETKEICKVVYPKRIKKYGNTLFWNNFMKNNAILFNSNDGAYDETYSGVKYYKTPIETVYNFHITINTGGFVLANYLDEEILLQMDSDPTISEIHIPYTSTLYGGLAMRELLDNFDLRHIVKKIRCNRFVNIEEKEECNKKYNYNRIVLPYYGEVNEYADISKAFSR